MDRVIGCFRCRACEANFRAMLGGSLFHSVLPKGGYVASRFAAGCSRASRAGGHRRLGETQAAFNLAAVAEGFPIRMVPKRDAMSRSHGTGWDSPEFAPGLPLSHSASERWPAIMAI
jgi:hypothetical protein